MSGHDVKRIHFLTDVEKLEDGYRCERCGHTASKFELYERRKGFLNRCFRKRIKQKWNELRQ